MILHSPRFTWKKVWPSLRNTNVFFSFHIMNEKVKIREPRHTLAQPLSLKEERFVSFIKQTVFVSTKSIVIFPVGIFGDLSR